MMRAPAAPALQGDPRYPPLDDAAGGETNDVEGGDLTCLSDGGMPRKELRWVPRQVTRPATGLLLRARSRPLLLAGGRASAVRYRTPRVHSTSPANLPATGATATSGRRRRSQPHPPQGSRRFLIKVCAPDRQLIVMTRERAPCPLTIL